MSINNRACPYCSNSSFKIRKYSSSVGIDLKVVRYDRTHEEDDLLIKCPLCLRDFIYYQLDDFPLFCEHIGHFSTDAVMMMKKIGINFPLLPSYCIALCKLISHHGQKYDGCYQLVLRINSARYAINLDRFEDGTWIGKSMEAVII